MLEEILSFALLAELELLTKSTYLEKLDSYFITNSNSEILLELEFMHENTNDAINKIFNSYLDNLDLQLFGKLLFQNIESIYLSNEFTINEFAQKMYLLWNLYIPHPINEKEPFWTLSYADDCLSYGDENQTRLLYEKAFKYYH
ncbi:hypothetical protein JZO73_08010 [Enterococcus plantarum]|uniref:hypothetical protein n=1 Tax=Enterococcus plantarum TaxID=1077675 RepID=UPI001A8D78F3|nr:hypothetical protein [Enterococcus plantarum]MBO0467480.1 hypothetical protein [Enterococcus plantarum]